MAEKQRQQQSFDLSQEQYAKAVYEEGGSLVVNMADVEEAKFETLPRGVYPAEVDELEFGMSQNSGAPMLTVTFRISDGEYTGRKQKWYASFSQKAMPYTKRLLGRLAPELITQ